jgi:hypothetical protein
METTRTDSCPADRVRRDATLNESNESSYVPCKTPTAPDPIPM